MSEAEARIARAWLAPGRSAGSRQIQAVGPGRFILSGEFDASNAHELQSALESAETPAECVLDCRVVLYMDSSALHVLVRAARTQQKTGGKLVILSPSSFARRLLEVSGVARDANIEVRESE